MNGIAPGLIEMEAKASFSFPEEAEKKIDLLKWITTDKIVDYWVENFLDLSEADTQLEAL